MIHSVPKEQQYQQEINHLLSQRITALEEKVGVIEIKQNEQEEELKELKYDFKFFKRYIAEENRGWRVFQTVMVIIMVIAFLSIIWLIAS
jgi:hypothetical protein